MQTSLESKTPTGTKAEETHLEDIEEKEMSFLDHLEELRWHLVRSVVSIFVFAIIAFFAKSFIFHTLILGPSRTDFWTYQALCELGLAIGSDVLCIEQLPFSLQSRTMTGQFSMHITVAFVVGLICAFPYTFWEIWRFIKPGLYPTEKRLTNGAVFFVTLLFALGVSFGYFIVSPLSINFLSNYQIDESIVNEFDITSYISTITTLVLSCGLMFQLPMIVFVLSKAGLATPDLMRAFRRHASVVILVLSAIITPPDVVSQVLVSLPLFLLYEVSIYISASVVKSRQKALAKLQQEVKGQDVTP
jgi:sec-independent protein translocase protein TatC